MSIAKSKKMSTRNRENEANDLDEKRKKLMDDIKEDDEQNNEYRISQTVIKNIILVGRSRTGKSTIRSLLLDPTTIPETLSLFSGTKSPVVESYHVSEKNCVLNIIDTPGLVERAADKIEARDNENLLKIIDECINREFTKCHIVCFCISMACGIGDQDIEVFRVLMNIFGKSISSNSCLIITHCESKSEEEQSTLKSELLEDTRFKEIASFFKQGIFFSGALNRDNYKKANDVLFEEFVSISGYRKELIKLFTSDITPCMLETTGISELRRVREYGMAKENLLQQASKELKAKENDLQNKKNLIQEMDSDNKQHIRTIAMLQEQCRDDNKKQKDLEMFLSQTEEKLHQTEEDLRKEQENHRKTKNELHEEQESHCTTKELLQKEQEGHKMTKLELHGEQKDHELSKQELEEKVVAHDRLLSSFNEQVEKLQMEKTELLKQLASQVTNGQKESLLREEAERERDAAKDTLRKREAEWESLVEQLHNKNIQKQIICGVGTQPPTITVPNQLVSLVNWFLNWYHETGENNGSDQNLLALNTVNQVAVPSENLDCDSIDEESTQGPFAAENEAENLTPDSFDPKNDDLNCAD